MVFQVDRVIAEATSFDNLALLYEGWTAWVWLPYLYRDNTWRFLTLC